MRRALYLTGALVALGVAGTIHGTHAQSPATARATSATAASPAPTVANVAMPVLTPEEQRVLARRFSPERLDAFRARVRADAQRAVHDEAEQAFREPTDAEAAALALRAPEATGVSVPLANGGAAFRAEPAHLDFLKVTIGADGAVVGHDGKGARREK